MTMFELYGPCELFVEKLRNERIIRDDIFWPRHSKIHNRIGCYIYAVVSPKTPEFISRYRPVKSQLLYDYTPYFVGSTTKSFRTECFKPENMKHFCKTLPKGGNKKAVMIFIMHPQTDRKKSTLKDIEELKTFLIQSGKIANISLCDPGGDMPDWGIKGVIKKTKKGGSSKFGKDLKKMLGFDVSN